TPLLFEFGAVADDFALPRCPGGKAAATRTTVEISLGFALGQNGDFTGNAYLPFQTGPIENQGRVRVHGEFLAFSAIIICEENEATLVQALQEDNASRGPALFVGRRECHRIDVHWLSAADHEESLI